MVCVHIHIHVEVKPGWKAGGAAENSASGGHQFLTSLHFHDLTSILEQRLATTIFRRSSVTFGVSVLGDVDYSPCGLLIGLAWESGT
jgi:hypothetical protein